MHVICIILSSNYKNGCDDIDAVYVRFYAANLISSIAFITKFSFYLGKKIKKLCIWTEIIEKRRCNRNTESRNQHYATICVCLVFNMKETLTSESRWMVQKNIIIFVKHTIRILK